MIILKKRKQCHYYKSRNVSTLDVVDQDICENSTLHAFNVVGNVRGAYVGPKTDGR